MSTESPADREEEPTPDAGQTPPIDPALYLQLSSELLRQMAWLGAAAAGGMLVLLEAEIMDIDWISGSALILFAATVLVSVRGQEMLVDRFADGRDIKTTARRVRGLVMFLLGLGAGILGAGVYLRWLELGR